MRRPLTASAPPPCVQSLQAEVQQMQQKNRRLQSQAKKANDRSRALEEVAMTLQGLLLQTSASSIADVYAGSTESRGGVSRPCASAS